MFFYKDANENPYFNPTKKIIDQFELIGISEIEFNELVNPQKSNDELFYEEAKKEQSIMIEELNWCDLQMKYIEDNDDRMEACCDSIREHRKACRNHVKNIDGVLTIVGDRPVRPCFTKKEKKRAQLRVFCSNAITGMFKSDAMFKTGEEDSDLFYHYDCREEDQRNLDRVVSIGNGGDIYAHDGTEFKLVNHNHAQASELQYDMETHIRSQRVKLSGLIAQVNAVAEDENEDANLKLIKW